MRAAEGRITPTGRALTRAIGYSEKASCETNPTMGGLDGWDGPGGARWHVGNVVELRVHRNWLRELASRFPDHVMEEVVGVLCGAAVDFVLGHHSRLSSQDLCRKAEAWTIPRCTRRHTVNCGGERCWPAVVLDDGRRALVSGRTRRSRWGRAGAAARRPALAPRRSLTLSDA